MTEMRIVSVPIPEDIDKAILEIKKDDRFIRSSYSEIVRTLLTIGLDRWETQENKANVSE